MTFYMPVPSDKRKFHLSAHHDIILISLDDTFVWQNILYIIDQSEAIWKIKPTSKPLVIRFKTGRLIAILAICGRLPRILGWLLWTAAFTCRHDICVFHVLDLEGKTNYRDCNGFVTCQNIWSYQDKTSGTGRHRLNTPTPRQNDRYFTDEIFKCIFNENKWISIEISLKFVLSK